MGIWSGTKKVLGHVIDIRVDRWMDFETIKAIHKIYVKQIKNLLTSQRAKRVESFEAAVERLNLSEKELSRQAIHYRWMAYFFLLISIALFIYALTTLYFRNWMGFVMNLALILYSISSAFRYHFWYFQIMEKKLGCTPLDWYKFAPWNKRKTP